MKTCENCKNFYYDEMELIDVHGDVDYELIPECLENHSTVDCTRGFALRYVCDCDDFEERR